MYCPRCGKEIPNEDAKYCPECGAPVALQATMSGDDQRNDRGSAAKAVCVICAIAAIAIPFISCVLIQDNDQVFDAWWFEYGGGLGITIMLGIVAIIAGIISAIKKR